MMFEDDIEFTIEDTQEKCEDCKFYLFIDSGYGYCRRFPPKEEKVGRWWKPKWAIYYQLVEWCRIACGEFGRRSNPDVVHKGGIGWD